MPADSTLVNLSLEESLSRSKIKIRDLSPLFESNTKSMESYYKLTDNLFQDYIKQEQIIDAGKRKQLNAFQKTLQKQHEKLTVNGETMSQKVVDALDREIRRLQEEYMAVNTYGRDDTIENERARTRLEAELVAVTNQAYKARQTFDLLYEQRDSWVEGALDPTIMAAQNKMMGVDIDNDDDVQVAFINGELTFYARNFLTGTRTVTPSTQQLGGFNTELLNIGAIDLQEAPVYEEYQYGEAAYTVDQMRENFPAALLDKDRQVISLVNDMQQEAFEAGKSGVMLNFNEEEVLGQLDLIIQKPEHFRSLGLRRVGMGGDNVRMTLGRPSFLTELKLSGNYGIQLDLMDASFQLLFKEMIEAFGEDGVIDIEDLETAADPDAFRENYNMMIDVLTNINNENFDFERSKKLLMGYFKDIIEEKYQLKHADGWQNDANPNKGMGVVFGKDVPLPSRKDKQLEYVAAKAIERGERLVVIQQEEYLLQSDGTYKLYRREGPGYAPYTEEDLQQRGKHVFTKYELAKQLKYYAQYIDTDYKFKQGR